MKRMYAIVQMVGAVLLLVGAMLQITRWEISPYIYTLGGSGTLHHRCCDVCLCAGHEPL